MIRALKFLRRTLRSGLGEEGSALVELGLSLPMLCAILLGGEELARFAYTAIETANAAHAGAIYAASGAGASSDTPGISNAAAADSGNLMGNSAVSVVSATPACTCSNGTSPTSCSDNSTCSSAGAGMITTVTVTTQAKFYPLFRLPGGAAYYTVHGSSSQVVSNQ